MKTYTVIGTATQFAVTDFGLHTKIKLSAAKAAVKLCKSSLAEAKFSNGCKARRWMWDFNSYAEAENFVHRCNSALAFQAGRRDKWIVPCFVAVATATLKARK